MRKNDLPSPEYLRQRLRYDPETGKLYWRYYEPHGTAWNNRWAGRRAFETKMKSGHLMGRLDGTNHLAHRVIWTMETGRWPEEEIDHGDHDGSNNRLGNLSECSHGKNGRNQPLSKVNTSGVTGVHWCKQTQRWEVRMTHQMRPRFLGRFDSFDAAVAARKEAERRYDFHPNHGT